MSLDDEGAQYENQVERTDAKWMGISRMGP